MSNSPQTGNFLRVGDLRPSGEYPFRIEPDESARAELAKAVGALALRKTRFEGELRPSGQRGWVLKGHLGATAVQECIVTLEPVTTRVDTKVTRHFVPEDQIDTPEAGTETEIPQDDTIEPLTDVIDLDAVMAEALSLALPSYPRKDDAELGEAVFAEDGAKPLRDDDVKPFAGLAALRDKLQDKGE